MSWENYGDVNPIDHGGMFVKHDDQVSGRNYYVVSLQNFVDEGERKWLLIDGYIDLDDDWIEWESIKATMDTDEGASDEWLACDVMHYYGTHCSNSESEIIESESDVRDRLKQMEINFE